MSTTPRSLSVEVRHYWKPDDFDELDEPYDLESFELWDFPHGPSWLQCCFELGTYALEEVKPFRTSPLAEWQRGLPALAFTDLDFIDSDSLAEYLAAVRIVLVDESGARRPDPTNSAETDACEELAAQALVAAERAWEAEGAWLDLEDNPDVDHDPEAIAVAEALADEEGNRFARFVSVVDLGDGRRVIAFGPNAVPDLSPAGQP